MPRVLPAKYVYKKSRQPLRYLSICVAFETDKSGHKIVAVHVTALLSLLCAFEVLHLV